MAIATTEARLIERAQRLQRLRRDTAFSLRFPHHDPATRGNAERTLAWVTEELHLVAEELAALATDRNGTAARHPSNTRKTPEGETATGTLDRKGQDHE